MIDEKYLKGTIREGKSYTVINNGNATSTVTNLYYEQLQEQSDRDYVEVVRCKDCKYYGSNWWMGDCHLERWGNGWANYPPPRVTEDGYCAWGERKEDAKID